MGEGERTQAGWQKSVSSRENIVGHGQSYFADWQMAFPAIRYVEDNPIGAMLANKARPLSRGKAGWPVRSGLGREICGYQGTCWGAQFLGVQEDAALPPPEICRTVPLRVRPAREARTAVRDFENVPQWMADTCMYSAPRSGARVRHERTPGLLRTSNLNDLERIFGQKCDDES